MGHRPQAELKEELERAETLVVVGGTYAHYKDTSKTYLLKELAIWESDGSICVVYQALFDEQVVVVRALSQWLETVEWQGRTVPRFSLVE